MLFLASDSQDSPARDSGANDSTGGEQSSAVKVELDLDDAPFLDEPEEKSPSKTEKETGTPQAKIPEPEAPEPKKSFLTSKKKLAVLLFALALIVTGAAGIFFFFFSDGNDDKAGESAEKKRVVVVTSQKTEEASPAVQVVDLQPFVVPSRGSEGEIRLLHCTLRIPYDEEIQKQELEARRLEVRDAIYYYLVNKPLSHLSSPEEADLLKQDIVNVINELLTLKKITEIYIQEYVITTP